MIPEARGAMHNRTFFRRDTFVDAILDGGQSFGKHGDLLMKLAGAPGLMNAHSLSIMAPGSVFLFFLVPGSSHNKPIVINPIITWKGREMDDKIATIT